MDFRTPFVEFKRTPEGAMVGYLTDYWQRKFAKLFQGPDWKGPASDPAILMNDAGMMSAVDFGFGTQAALLESQQQGVSQTQLDNAVAVAALFEQLQVVTGPLDPNQAALLQVIGPTTTPSPDPTAASMLIESVNVRRFSDFTFIFDAAANITIYAPGSYPSAYFITTDAAPSTFVTYYSNGSAWVEILAPGLLKLLGSTNAFPALKRSGAVIQIRLADDSAYTALEVLDEAYGAGWDGKVEVPTKNAVYDQFVIILAAISALISDTAYGAGWDTDTTHGASKNALYDKIQTLLSQNGVNFGPGPVASVTIVNGQVTAIS